MDLIGAGREADVYALDEGRVLRRYRRGDDAAGEAELMAYLGAHGFPVPRVHDVSGADLVMDRLDGGSMAAALGDGRIDVAEGAAMLAGLHRLLHDVPARSGLRDGDRILHRDLHPENVMVTPRGPVVIDWHIAAEGPPAVDVCLTAIILAQVAADPGHRHAAVAGELAVAFLSEVGSEVLVAFDEAIEIRQGDPSLSPAEAANLAATVGPWCRQAAPRSPRFR